MWLVTIYVMRHLHPADYGLMSMAGILTVFANIFLDFGLGAAFIQKQNVSLEIYKSANFLLFLIACAAILIVNVFAGPVSSFFSVPLIEPVLRVSSIQLLFSAMTILPNIILINEMRFKEASLIQAAAGIGSSLVILGLVNAGMGVWALVLGGVSASLMKLLSYYWYTGLIGFSRNLSCLIQFRSYSSYLIAQRMAYFFIDQIDLFAIGRFLGAVPLGVYSVARNLSHIPLDRMAEIINQVTFPSFAARQYDADCWQEALQKLIRLGSAVSYPIFWGMAVTAQIALPLILGKKWEGVVLPFILFSVILPLRAIYAFKITVILALGRADLVFKSFLLLGAILSPAFLVGLFFGVEGVCAAWVIGFPLVYISFATMISRSLNIRVLNLFIPMAAPAIASFGCVIAVIGSSLLLWDLISHVILLVLQMLIFILVYLILLRLIGRLVFDEVKEFLAQMIGLR